MNRTKTKNKTSALRASKNTNRQRSKMSRKPVTETMAATKTVPKKKTRRSLGQLIHAKLKEIGPELTKNLADRALEGNVGCARFLWALSEETKRERSGRKKRSSFSLAKALAAEPEWTAQENAGSEDGNGQDAIAFVPRELFK